jgi:HEPN domain-containing protein
LSFEEAEVLRERADAFLENAKHLINTGSYDLAAFNLEQHCQLLLNTNYSSNRNISTHAFLDKACRRAGKARAADQNTA